MDPVILYRRKRPKTAPSVQWGKRPCGPQVLETPIRKTIEESAQILDEDPEREDRVKKMLELRRAASARVKNGAES